MDKEIKNAVIALESGETILYPTDTVWGIGCNALSDNAAKKIFKLKKRDYSNGLICLASSFEMISKYAEINQIEKLNKISDPIVSTSANLSGFKVPLNFNDIKSEIKENVGYVVQLDQFRDCNVSSKILKYNYNNNCFDRLRWIL